MLWWRPVSLRLKRCVASLDMEINQVQAMAGLKGTQTVTGEPSGVFKLQSCGVCVMAGGAASCASPTGSFRCTARCDKECMHCAGPQLCRGTPVGQPPRRVRVQLYGEPSPGWEDGAFMLGMVSTPCMLS